MSDRHDRTSGDMFLDPTYRPRKYHGKLLLNAFAQANNNANKRIASDCPFQFLQIRTLCAVVIFESICILIYLIKLHLFATWIEMVLSLWDFDTFENARRILQRSTIFLALRKFSNLAQHEGQLLRRTRKPFRMSFKLFNFCTKVNPSRNQHFST